jgi:hypothetical protein
MAYLTTVCQLDGLYEYIFEQYMEGLPEAVWIDFVETSRMPLISYVLPTALFHSFVYLTTLSVAQPVMSNEGIFV